MVSKLKALKVINAGTLDDLLKELCCDVRNENCLEGSCELCKKKEVQILDFDADELASYEKWKTKRVEVTVKGLKKLCHKTVKETIECKKGELLNAFKESIKSFLIHTRNIIHQYNSVDTIKKNLSSDEILIHIDFSENYNCKYGREIQSAHFGGSKPQVSLHTVVMYHKSSKVVPVSLCTLSEDLRHDPSAICAHLEKIIKEARHIVPNLKSVYFLSDGPSTQYKNKKMFYLMAKFITKQLNVENLRWIYSEPGHGKGAPDGVGGCLKRTADNLVAQGRDIPNFTTLVQELTENCSGIQVLSIDSKRILEIDSTLSPNIKPFKGTMSIRELTWSRNEENVLQVRKLCCFKCTENCTHYGLGKINFDYLENSSNFTQDNILSNKVIFCSLNLFY